MKKILQKATYNSNSVPEKPDEPLYLPIVDNNLKFNFIDFNNSSISCNTKYSHQFYVENQAANHRQGLVWQKPYKFN